MKLPDHWFYGSAADGHARFTFSPEETTHATKVLRLRVGDALQWLDGAGGRYRGRITDLARSGMSATASTTELEPAPVAVRLSVGILHDSARLEWLIEKAVELRVTEVDLLRTTRVQPARFKMARLLAKAVGAMKQSGGAFLPSISVSTLDEVLADAGGGLSPKPTVGESLHAAVKVIAHCDESLPRTPVAQAYREGLRNFVTPEGPALHLLIGPEGDFTTEEIARAEAAGFDAVSLGSARLRTETAALAALAAWALR